jgi:hypothetical protein
MFSFFDINFPLILILPHTYYSFLLYIFLYFKMPYLWILLCLLTSVVCIQFGMQVSDPYEYPYYMMLGNPHICGGALLSYDPAYVLTAAHCVADASSHPSDHDKDDNPYFVGYHDTNRKNQKTMRIADWVIHPSYNISNTVDMNYDVAIVKLESPLKISNRIRRIALWSSNMTSSIPTQGKRRLLFF